MNNTYNLLFKGFRSKEQIHAFISWYIEEGEQIAEEWFEQCNTEAEEPFSAYVNINKSLKISKDNQISYFEEDNTTIVQLDVFN